MTGGIGRLLLIACAAACTPSPAGAWGYAGHRIIAAIARAELSPAVRARVDAILATDTDDLTAHDMLDEATWADAWRAHGHRETAMWHYVDIEIDGTADIDAACFGHPTPAGPASAGPSRDCIVDKIRAFASELAAPGTAPVERLLALKYLLHLTGDLHQPLHASDNHDRGGNCVLLALGGVRTQSLHAWWDTSVVTALGSDPATVAQQLRAQITPAQRRQWQQGDPARWAQEAFAVSRAVAYQIGSPPGCAADAAPRPLPQGYARRAQAAAAIQLERAGVRLAALLDMALGRSATPPAAMIVPPLRSPSPSPSNSPPPHQAGRAVRSAISLACSQRADGAGLHGKQRPRFRRSCMRR